MGAATAAKGRVGVEVRVRFRAGLYMKGESDVGGWIFDPMT